MEGFKTRCIPFLGLGGCHLREKYLGLLLAATTLDENNGFFHVAFAIVESEGEDTWRWFLANSYATFEGE